MKSLITKLSLSLMLLAFGSGLHAQGPKVVYNLAVNVSPALSIYPTYGVTTTMSVDFANGSSFTLPPGTIYINISLPTNCAFNATFNAGPNWNYVYTDSKNVILVNTSPIIPFSSPLPGGSAAFSIPFSISGPIPASPAQNIVAMINLPISAIPYVLPGGAVPTSISQMKVMNASPLGVQFSSFLALNKGCTNDISWSTASEKGNDYFNVERSKNGKDFTSLAQIPSKGSRNLMQNYSFVDANPIMGTNYYRIRQTDLDKVTTLTTVKQVETNCTMSDISIYPNPTYNVVYVKGLAEGQTVELYNALGQLVHKVDVKSETEVLDISKLTDGVYNIRVLRNNVSIFTIKLVKR